MMKRLVLTVTLVAFVSMLCGCVGVSKSEQGLSEIIYGPDPNREIDESQVNYFVSLTGNDSNDGRSRKSAFRTMQKAVNMVKAGETVLVCKGRYKHGFLVQNKFGRADAWINIIGEPGAEINGADLVKNWRKEPGFKYPVYSTEKPNINPHYQKPETRFILRVEQVFVNGKILNHASEKGMLKPRDVFWVDDVNKKLFVCLKDGKNPNTEKTEVTKRSWAISIGATPNQNWWRDEKSQALNRAAYIRISGFKIRDIGNFSRMAAIQIRGTCDNIIVENCDVQWINYRGIAADSLKIFAPKLKKWLWAPVTNVFIRNNIASNCGVQAITNTASDTIIEKNIMDYNNYKGYSPWGEGGGVKAAYCSNVNIRHNILRDSNNHGLWYDYAHGGNTIENNFIYRASAGGILNEVNMPLPKKFTEDGKEEYEEPSLELIKSLKYKGTVIRNNVIVCTVGHGGGINNSSSCRAQIYNNVIVDCKGNAINNSGRPTRIHTQGNNQNTYYSNIAYGNYGNIDLIPPELYKHGLGFGNVFRDNLFMNWKSRQPTKINGKFSSLDKFFQIPGVAKSNKFIKSGEIFRDPKKFDFTIINLKLAKNIGFDSNALRMDWTEYHIPERKMASAQCEDLTYTPITLDSVLNRGLEDEIANDGKGGWSDQGRNDLRNFPTGKQTFAGVDYVIAPKKRAAMLLKNSRMKEGGAMPEEAKIKVDAKFKKLFFLYTAAWCGDTIIKNGEKIKLNNPEVARFIVNYADGTKAEIPLVYTHNILDWWADPESDWRKCAALNDNNCFVAWKGPNDSMSSVSVYSLNWSNPEPTKEIKSITINRAGSKLDCAFFLLGISGGNPLKKKRINEQTFHMGFEGNVDAEDTYGNEIEATGINRASFKAALFAAGIKGKGAIPQKRLYYVMPEELPTSQGTISIWLKADDWSTPERIKDMKKSGYRKIMWPLSLDFLYCRSKGKKRNFSPWGWCIRFFIDEKNYKNITLHASFASNSIKEDITDKIEPDKWFNICLVWKDSEKSGFTKQKVYLNSKLLAAKESPSADYSKVKAKRIIVGIPDNGGQPWFGVMDELSIWDRPFTAAEVTELNKEFQAKTI